MSDMQNNQGENAAGWMDPGKQNAQLVYILYLVGLAIGISVIVGVVFAYINRGKSAGWIDTHYTYAIRTFWIGLLYSLICMVLAIVGIGFLLMIAVLVWYVIRCIKGIQVLTRNEPVANVDTWLV
ncbi:MAG: membrane protein [Rhizobiaceae bacterium MnEN-MB40S]|nr:MAG: membrane protein [Rhizobiaceae bacterium MnEN-MB40S]